MIVNTLAQHDCCLSSIIATNLAEIKNKIHLVITNNEQNPIIENGIWSNHRNSPHPSGWQKTPHKYAKTHNSQHKKKNATKNESALEKQHDQLPDSYIWNKMAISGNYSKLTLRPTYGVATAPKEHKKHQQCTKQQ